MIEEKKIRIDNNKSETESNKINYSDFFNRAHRNISQTDYLIKERGISEEILNRFNIGYIERWYHPKKPNTPKSPRIIIPTSNQSYIARLAKEPETEIEKQYKIIKVGNRNLFNTGTLKSNEPVFIAEGEIDALSIIEGGGQAIGLGGISNIKLLFQKEGLINALNKTKSVLLLLCLDNDNSGKEGTRKIMEYIKENNKSLAETTIDISEEISNGYKDPNEALLKNPEDFKKFIQNLKQVKLEEMQIFYTLKYEKYNKYSVNKFMNHIKQKDHKTIKTGFGKLDDFFGGGLYPGLYILGAASGVGKTTFILQIADYIARTEKEVLFFSGEMSGIEIIAKSLSRLSKINEGKETGIKALTTRNILALGEHPEYESNIEKLKNIYINTTVRKMRILSGRQSFESIKSAVEECENVRGNSPVVFIDYLQIMKFNDKSKHNEIRYNINETISELRMLAITHGMPVVAVSRLNYHIYKKSYTEQADEKEVALTSFKESGSIEYSADVIMELSAAKIKHDCDKNKQPKTLNMKIIKNRYGTAHCDVDNLSFIFHYKHSYFEEIRLSQYGGEYCNNIEEYRV